MGEQVAGNITPQIEWAFCSFHSADAGWESGELACRAVGGVGTNLAIIERSGSWYVAEVGDNDPPPDGPGGCELARVWGDLPFDDREDVTRFVQTAVWRWGIDPLQAAPLDELVSLFKVSVSPTAEDRAAAAVARIRQKAPDS